MCILGTRIFIILLPTYLFNYHLYLIYIFFSEVNSKWLNSFILKEISITDPAFCPNKCGHSYKGKSRRAHLKRHLIYECGVPKKFKCDRCFKMFSYNVGLQKHYNICTRNISYNNHNIFFNN